MTEGGEPTAVPTVADCDVTLLATRLLAVDASPDAVNVIVGRPATLAATALLFVPAVCPTIHDVSVAVPVASVATVATLAGLIAPPMPPLDVSTKLTFTP